MITDIATNKSNIEELTARIDELSTNEGISIVDSVEKLDTDAEVGSLASVISTVSAPLSEDYEYHKILTENVRITFPSHVDFSIMDNTTFDVFTLAHTNSASATYHIFEVIKNSEKYTIGWGTGMTADQMMHPVCAEYDLDGDLLGSPEDLLAIDIAEMDSRFPDGTEYYALTPDELNFLDNFITIDNKKSKGTLFSKNSNGWKQYSEIPDSSITATKIANKVIESYHLTDELLNQITNSGEGVTVQIVDKDIVGIPLAGIRKQTDPSASSPFYPHFVSEKDITNNEDADATPGNATVVYLDDYTSYGIYVIKEYQQVHDTYNDIFAFVGFPAKYGTESNSDAYISESLIIKESRYVESGIEAFAQYKYDSSIYRLNDESSADNGKLYSFNNTRIIQEVIPKKSVSIQEAIDDIYSKLALLTT